ncbi:MAG: phosphopentomutase [Anaerolineaceae bacterium]
MKRAILLVLDGLGIGAMPDTLETRPQDTNANTLGCILQHNPQLNIPTLTKLGLLNSLHRDQEKSSSTLASWGWCKLAYQGADSYLGHQEIMGAIPLEPQKTLMWDKVDEFEKILKDAGFHISRLIPGKPLLCVNDAIIIGDNLEADAGQNINLTVCTDLINFDKAIEIGKIIRNNVQVARVIVFGGQGLTLAKILEHVEQRENGQVGVNSPAIGVYNENLHVKHMGFGVDPRFQAASIFAHANIPVFLDGKMADLIECEQAVRNPIVETKTLLDCMRTQFNSIENGFIAATVQETDLAAHGGEIDRFATILETVDIFLSGFLPQIQNEDLLIITADHGNDPGLKTGLHTREFTPLLVFSPNFVSTPLGRRESLADIGASLVQFFNLPKTQNGKAFITEINRGKNEI